MIEVFDSVGALTHAIDVHLQGKPFGQYIGTIHRTRTAVQHTLLLLPTLDELNLRPSEKGEDKKNIYECCRLAGLIYGVAVVYPVPNSYGVLQELVKRLQRALIVLDIESCGRTLDGVLLWMVTLGGIAALDKPERVWFASQLGDLMRRQGMDGWDNMEGRLESFLWLESACGQGWHMLWDEARAGSYGET
jgi:Fungal specific transcription factor domain